MRIRRLRCSSWIPSPIPTSALKRSRNSRPAGRGTEPEPLANHPYAGRSALVVTANPIAAQALLDFLAGCGMTGEAVRPAEAAASLERAAGADSPFALLIVDPEADPDKCAEALQEFTAGRSREQARAILLTPLNRRNSPELAGAETAISIAKPFQQSDLEKCLAAFSVANLECTPDLAALGRIHGHDSVSPAESPSTLKILVAEDNAVNQQVILKTLEKLGYAADMASNGVEALNLLSRAVYDLVLMDCEMPEMDGFEATAEIRRREGTTRHTVVVAMTAHALAGDRERCLAAGMDDYICKPLRSSDLDQVIRKWQSASISSVS